MKDNRLRLGMITPSSNTVLEPYVGAILHGQPNITAHFQRFAVREISMDDRALAQFANEALVGAARLLGDARVNAISWAGTAASWRGFDVDRELCREISEATGVEATTSVLAINEILALTGVERLGLVTPYLDEVQDKIVGNYNAAGHRVTAERHMRDRGNFSFADYGTETVAGLIREVAREGPQAIIVLCTNFRGAPVVEELERDLNIPVYDSVSATVWKMMRMVGRNPSEIGGWGRLFREIN